jgi:hypothetical protein
MISVIEIETARLRHNSVPAATLADRDQTAVTHSIRGMPQLTVGSTTEILGGINPYQQR